MWKFYFGKMFGFFCSIAWEHLNELFDQPRLWTSNVRVHKSSFISTETCCCFLLSEAAFVLHGRLEWLWQKPHVPQNKKIHDLASQGKPAYLWSRWQFTHQAASVTNVSVISTALFWFCSNTKVYTDKRLIEACFLTQFPLQFQNTFLFLLEFFHLFKERMTQILYKLFERLEGEENSRLIFEASITLMPKLDRDFILKNFL